MNVIIIIAPAAYIHKIKKSRRWNAMNGSSSVCETINLLNVTGRDDTKFTYLNRNIKPDLLFQNPYMFTPRVCQFVPIIPQSGILYCLLAQTLQMPTHAVTYGQISC